MLNKEQIKEEAQRLDKAERNSRQVHATTVNFPEMTIEDAYEIQEAWVKKKLRTGRKVIGHKVGLTSRTMQKAMKIDEPDYGVLLDDMHFQNGATLWLSDFLDLRVEVELAFVLNRPLEAKGLTIEKVIEASSRIVPAMELIAARTFRIHPETGYVRTVKDSISDNAANAGIILGDNHIDPVENDLRWVSALLYKNGLIEESGVAASVLDHPANGVLWLARKYAEYGRVLEAGQIILAGSFTRPLKIEFGDEIMADFGKFGTITCRFE